MWQQIMAFFSHPFFIIIGALTTLFMIVSWVVIVCKVLKGNLPVWFRLGMGLSNRKIAIFSESEFQNLQDMLIDSNLFNKNNIVRIEKNSLDRADRASLHLVHWQDFHEQIDDILNIKKDNDALIVYCPAPGRIDDKQMIRINQKRNIFVVNFRGRLLNDIFIAMMTTACR